MVFLDIFEEIWHFIVIIFIGAILCVCCIALWGCVIGLPVYFTKKKKDRLKRQYQNASVALGQSGGTRSASEVWTSTGYEREEADRVRREQRMDNILSIAASTGKAATGAVL